MHGSAHGLGADRAADWRDQASCRNHDPEWWYPLDSDHATTAAAKWICSRRPVRTECAEAGRREPFGIWGGLTERERRRAPRICDQCGREFRTRWSVTACDPCRAGVVARERFGDPAEAAREAPSYRRRVLVGEAQ